MKALLPLVKKLWQRLKFFLNVGQRSRSQGHRMVKFEMVSLMSTQHAKYDVPISYGSKVMAKVKVFIHM